MHQNPRTPVVLLAGLAAGAVGHVAEVLLRDPGTAVLHHDLRQITQGVVRRGVRWGGHEQQAVLELAHGCVSCTLREDMLPLVRQLARTPGVERIVPHLDPALQPEAICWALHHVVLDNETLDESVRVIGVITALDASTWLSDATGDTTLDEHGLAASADDERTVAQVAVGQVEFADALVVVGAAPNGWAGARTTAVLDRLAPGAPRTQLAGLDAEALLAAIPSHARRGKIDDAHGPLLRGQPPLEPECGVSVVLFSDRRPFHPDRLHTALDVLLDGVVRARARVWVAASRMSRCGWSPQAAACGSGMPGRGWPRWPRTSGSRSTPIAEPWRPCAGTRTTATGTRNSSWSRTRPTPW